MTDDLYRRYMKAFQILELHKSGCQVCRPDLPCEAGRPMYERFSRLQDAYRERVAKRRR
ncbi:hypothetical protein [Streptomyces sp. MN13]